ncbi:leucine-rich repeat and coiled-coil domain-containing protein 1, partial [Aplysia californica]|uniref:Leucine-rich repeat and coiled-coil domain-containing protein 1 n=1 Tax=Aplysia californica TaxID=6500 RepID=A0ABM1ADV6_APLCA
MAVSNDSKHLSLIDAGISNIWSLSLPSYLESLNLHGNHIQNISNLSHLVRLAHLDLSANQITVLDGLEKLESLKTLNLSCNLITSVDGVSHLRSLQRLDVSYNQVRDIGGLAELGFRHSQLQYVSLHGNKLRSVAHVVDSLRTVKSLRHLVLTQDGSGNPICSHQGYETELFSNLPQLESINDLDRSGKFNSTLDNVSFIPGLEAYLDFLLSSEKEQSSQESVTPQSLITPKIDAVMDQFRQKFLHGGETSSSMGLSASSPPSDNGQHTESMRKILSDREFSSQSLRKERPRARVGWQSSGEDSEPVQDVGSDRDGVMSNRRRKTEKSHSQQTGRSGKGARGGPQTQ